MSKPTTIFINRQPETCREIEEVFNIIKTPSVKSCYICNVNITFSYLDANGQRTEKNFAEIELETATIEIIELITKEMLCTQSLCTINIVFELIPSSLRISRYVGNEKELMNVIRAMKQYVKEGHIVEIQHIYKTCSKEGAMQEIKKPLYRLEPSGLSYLKRMAVRKNLEKLQCLLTMNICITFT